MVKQYALQKYIYCPINGLLNSRHLYTRFLIGQSLSHDVSSANQEQGRGAGR